MMDLMEEKDYPALFVAADEASITAQNKFFLYLRSYLIILILAALVAFQWPDYQFGAIASAVLFLVTLFLLVAMKIDKPDETWYNARALAESVKTTSWRLMMRAKPYQEDNSEQVFIQYLKDILSQNCNLSSVIPVDNDTKVAITERMSQIRGLNFEKRKEFYLKKRIEDQQKWYSNKSQINKKNGEKWFWFSIILHALAIFLLLLRIKAYTYQFPIEVISTIASAVLVWLQAKKYNELSVVYAHTAHEIALIISEATSVTDDDKFSNYVVNSENAFSREHTQWYAKKVS
jgi:hypothetical protein